MLKSGRFWIHFLVAWFVAASVLCGLIAFVGVGDLSTIGQAVAITMAYVLSAIMAWMHARAKAEQ